MNAVLLRVADLNVRYRRGPTTVHAVQDVSFDVSAGGAVGVVGESGSGKSSVARAIVGMAACTGIVQFNGDPYRPRPAPHGIQMIFQDPIGSINPQRPVIDVVGEPLLIRGVRASARRAAAAEMLEEVRLPPAVFAKRRASELSGGQAQRVAIARALLAEPSLLIADEPVSGLDVSVQAGVVNLLHRARVDHGVAVLFISHDLAVVRSLCDEVLVMREGRILEHGPVERVLSAPEAEYTSELIGAFPDDGDL